MRSHSRMPVIAATAALCLLAGLSPALLGQNLGRMTEVEGNNTIETATALALTADRFVKARGNIYPAGDVDYFSFAGNAGDRVYTAVQTLFDASASGDSVLTIYRADGTIVVEEDANDGTFNASSSTIAGATLPETETYYVQVRHNVATGTIRPYDLYVQLRSGAPVAETEPNNSLPGQPMAASKWMSGTVTAVSPGETDSYSLTLNAGDTVFLSLDPDPERDAVTFNPRLLFGPLGVSNQMALANDANATSPNSEAFFFTVKDPGTYTVQVDSIVSAGLGATATYHLSTSVLPAEVVTSTTYTSTDLSVPIPTGPGLAQSTLTIPGNPRIKKVRVHLNITHAFMQDMDVHLVTPGGSEIGLFTDIGAATVGGPENVMDLILDDDAALPFAFTLTKNMIVQPELAYRLGWLKGMNAGGTWTLVVRDDATGDGGVINSWGLEIIEEDPLPASTPTTLFATDFESGDAGFIHGGAEDEWELGLPTAAPFTTANSGTNCWKTDLDNTYNASASCDLVSPPINLSVAPAGTPIVFEWAMKYHMESANFDHFIVSVEEVGNPSNSQTVFTWLDATMNSTVGNPAVTIPESAGWGRHRANIDAFAGKTVQLRFKLTTDNTVQLGGVAIDDVSVTAFGLPAAEIAVEGNLTPIEDGDITPDLADHTDFGGVALTGSTVVRTFTIRSSGIVPLNLTGAPLVSITGPAAADFTVTQLPTTPVPIGADTTFQVTFNPSTLGPRQATITIPNDDGNENPYDFAIRGVGLNTPPTVVGTGIPDQTVPHNGTIDVDVAPYFTDLDGHPLTFTVPGNSAPLHITAVFVPPSTVHLMGLTPGTTQITVEASDGNGGTITDTFQASVGTPQPTVGPVPPPPTPAGYPSNRQTGLFDITIPVTNSTASPINGFRIRVNLSAHTADPLYQGLRLFTSTTSPTYTPAYLDYPFPVAVGETISVRLSFYSPMRRFPNPFTPIIDVTTLGSSQAPGPLGSGIPATIQRNAAGEILLTWASVPNRWYRIQYSDDLTNWYYSTIFIQASANQTQWRDNGPPFTRAAPAPTGRFYQVSETTVPVP